MARVLRVQFKHCICWEIFSLQFSAVSVTPFLKVNQSSRAILNPTLTIYSDQQSFGPDKVSDLVDVGKMANLTVSRGSENGFFTEFN